MNVGEAEKYWGFDPNIKKICKVDECSDIKQKNKKVEQKSFTWKWAKDGGKTVVDWCNSFDTWFSKWFPEWSKLKESLKSVKGTWTQTQ